MPNQAASRYRQRAAIFDKQFSFNHNMKKTEQTQDLSEEALALRREFYAGGMTHLDFACGRSSGRFPGACVGGSTRLAARFGAGGRTVPHGLTSPGT